MTPSILDSLRPDSLYRKSLLLVIAGYHDFKVLSLTPSVTLRVEVRHDEGEDYTSYYRGKSNLQFYFTNIMQTICIILCF